MAKKTNYYYVLVFTNTGAVYVTSIGEGKTAYWNRNEKPMEFSKAYAQSLVFGLNVNFHPCVMVHSEWEITDQPYRYEAGNFEWKEGEKLNG